LQKAQQQKQDRERQERIQENHENMINGIPEDIENNVPYVGSDEASAPDQAASQSAN